jgi:hypothetical protein
MQATVDEKNGTLTIVLPLQKPTPSISGKTHIVAKSGGSIPTSATIGGKPIVASVTCWIKP